MPARCARPKPRSPAPAPATNCSEALNDLAVIALTRWERQQLAAIWKFFPFASDISWHYLYTGPEDPEELPIHPGFRPQAFSAADPVSAAFSIRSS